jgi:hypothetical protein
VDCEVSTWSSMFSSCSRACGGGRQSRTRDITQLMEHHGKACPELEEARNCNTQPCRKADCKVSAWSFWSECTQTCRSRPAGAAGSQVRDRSVTRHNRAGGKACPSLMQSRACHDNQCPVDCALTGWNPWGPCTKVGSLTKGGSLTLRTQHTDPAGPCTLLPALRLPWLLLLGHAVAPAPRHARGRERRRRLPRRRAAGGGARVRQGRAVHGHWPQPALRRHLAAAAASPSCCGRRRQRQPRRRGRGVQGGSAHARALRRVEAVR